MQVALSEWNLHKELKTQLGLSKLSIPTKLILNKELLDIVLFKDDGFVDMMQEYSLFDAIIGEYSIPEIYILFEIWKIKKDKKTLDQILNKIDLYIRKYLFMFENDDRFDFGKIKMQEISIPLHQDSTYKNFKILLMKFSLILQSANKDFKDAIDNDSWGNTFFLETTFDKEVPNLSVSAYMIKRLFDEFPNKNALEIYGIQMAYAAVARAKDLYLVLIEIANIFPQLAKEDRDDIGLDENSYTTLLYLLKYYKNVYNKFVYDHKKFYAAEIKGISDLDNEQGIIDYIKESENAEKDLIVKDSLEFVNTCLDDNIEHIMQAKRKYLDTIQYYTSEQQVILLEKIVERCKEKLEKRLEEEDEYSNFYSKIRNDLRIYNELQNVEPNLFNSLVSAEYLYSIYVENQFQKEDFDYSCISIMYYKALERSINKIIYKPYRMKVLEYNKSDAISEDSQYLLSPNYYTYGKKEKQFKNDCELGVLAHLCGDVDKMPKLKEFLMSDFSLTPAYITKLSLFGQKLQDCVTCRNKAAHGNEIITYESVKNDKQRVYPTDSVEDARGLLREFLSIIYPYCVHS